MPTPKDAPYKLEQAKYRVMLKKIRKNNRSDLYDKLDKRIGK